MHQKFCLVATVVFVSLKENLEKLKIAHEETVHSLQEQHQTELQEIRVAHEVLIQVK